MWMIFCFFFPSYAQCMYQYNNLYLVSIHDHDKASIDNLARFGLGGHTEHSWEIVDCDREL